jgi:hypothetical protein
MLLKVFRQTSSQHFKRNSRRSSRHWIAALVKKLAFKGGVNVDHRNSVNNEKETATSSKEVNKRIRVEYDQGFRNLSNAT